MNPGRIPLLLLNNGMKLPHIGFGTYEGPEPSGEINCAIESAIDNGYRFFDCAVMYQNEIEIGEGMCAKMYTEEVTREELFVSSKLWNTYHDPAMVVDAFKISLDHLNLEYLDMYLMHWPMAYKSCFGLEPKRKSGSLYYSDTPYTKTWRAMEKLIEQGLTKSIGMSNFNKKQVTKILSGCRYKPVINEIESHPYLPNTELKEFCEQNGILTVGYCPLGCPGSSLEPAEGAPILLEDPVITEIAGRYSKTPAQIVLRWAIQRGTIPIPKSSKKERIAENMDIWDFCICKDDVECLNKIDRRVRYCHFKWVSDHPDYPFSEEV